MKKTLSPALVPLLTLAWACSLAWAQPSSDVDFSGLHNTPAPASSRAQRMPALPTPGEAAALIEVKAELLPQGDYAVLAMSVTNKNKVSAVLFDQGDLLLVDTNDTETPIDTSKGALTAKARNQIFKKTQGLYYGAVHPALNSVCAGDTARFLATFKAGNYVKGRLNLSIFTPYANPPSISVDFDLPHP